MWSRTPQFRHVQVAFLLQCRRQFAMRDVGHFGWGAWTNPLAMPTVATTMWPTGTMACPILRLANLKSNWICFFTNAIMLMRYLSRRCHLLQEEVGIPNTTQ